MVRAANSVQLIAVIPDSSVLFSELIHHAGAIITCQGNKVAHMVKISREAEIPVILCPTAFQDFKEWEALKIEGDKLRKDY